MVYYWSTRIGINSFISTMGLIVNKCVKKVEEMSLLSYSEIHEHCAFSVSGVINLVCCPIRPQSPTIQGYSFHFGESSQAWTAKKEQSTDF